MISKERKEESYKLISQHLVKSHDDGDVNSLFVRFSEIMDYVERYEMRMDNLVRSIDAHKEIVNENTENNFTVPS